MATVAKRYHVPFYVCAPTSTIDLNTATGDDICIEERPAEEVTEMWYQERMAPEGVKVYNLAFDVTDHDLIKRNCNRVWNRKRAIYGELKRNPFEEKA